MHKSSNLVKAAWTALGAAFITTLYQAVKSYFPASPLQSHVVTVIYCTIMTFVVGLAVLRRQERELERFSNAKVNFEALMEHLPGLACIVSRDGRLVRWNSRVESVLGYSAQELSKLSAPEALAEDYRSLVRQALAAAFQTGVAEMEAAWLTKDGRRIPCYLTGVRVLVGKQPCVLSIGIDISNRKRAEEKLRQSEAQYRRLLANLPDVTWTMNSSRQVTYVSANVHEMLGYAPQEILAGGRELRLSRIHADDLPAVSESYGALFVEGRIFDVEYRMLHKDGHWIWVRNRALRTFEQDGTLAADGILTDITQRKQAEQVDSQLAAIVMSSSNAIIGNSADGTIASWNPGAERMFGYSADEASGKHISMIVPPERLHEVPSVIGRAVRGERVGRFESVCLRKDGMRVEVDLAISPIIDRQGRVLGISTIASDISLRKRGERELLRAKEEAEAATRAKTQFLANISHELRTPMNGILGMTELALDTHLDAEQREYLLTIQSSGNALLRLISELLDFTRTDSGTLALERVTFDLGEILRQTLRPVLSQAQQVGLEFACDIDPGLPDYVRGDPQRLRQVLVNLMDNAVKFTHQGRVLVRSICRSRTQVLFEVSDTGIGIPAEKHATIFEPFTQNDGSSTRRYGGTGLGLAISARLAELMGGSISLQSEPGVGSTFSFTVPLGLPSEPAHSN